VRSLSTAHPIIARTTPRQQQETKRRLVTPAERLSVMRAVTSLMIECLPACGTSPAPEQAWDEQDNRGGQQAQLDAQAIMAGMDQARTQAALLARTGR
jgi:hypothetical protein